MAPYLNCLAPLSFFAIGLWLFLTWPFWSGLFAFFAIFLLGSMLGTIIFKRYATDQQIKDDLKSRLSND